MVVAPGIIRNQQVVSSNLTGGSIRRVRKVEGQSRTSVRLRGAISDLFERPEQRRFDPKSPATKKHYDGTQQDETSRDHLRLREHP